jgi:putative membrane protein
VTHQHGYGSVLPLVVVLLAVGYEVLSLFPAVRGRRWSPWRGASFLTGCLLMMLAVAPARDGGFPAHVGQHLLIGMLAPLALVLGAPMTLVLRTLPAKHSRFVGRFMRHRPIRLLAHPVTALGLTVGGLVVVYFTPLYSRTTTDPVAHHLVHLHFLLSGYLFAWVIAGPDPAPRRPSVPLRLVVLGVAVAAHAVVSQLMYAGAGVNIPVPPPDRRDGATIMYYGGDAAELLLALALVTTWRPRRPDRRQRFPASGQGTADGMTDTHDAILVGGPRDGALFRSDGDAVAELEIDGLIHRYLVTTKQRERDGASFTVYNYDGVIDPSGAQPGIETPDGGHHEPVSGDRLASS